MALSDKNIIITPNIGSASDPKIQFSGADASTGAQTITLNVYPTSGGMLSFEGSNGQLFSIANSLTGTIYAVSDISGVPSIEVLDSGLVKLAQYNGTVVIGGSTTDGTAKLQVSGGPSRFGNIYVGYGTYKNSIRPVGDSNMNLDTPDGYTGSGTSLRAPIFYDIDNTGFYINPASSSNLNTVYANFFCGNSGNAYGQYKGYDNNNHFIAIRGVVGGTTSSPSITGGHNTTFVEYAEANDSTGWFFKTAATGNYDVVSRITRSYSYFESSARSPIFYDSDNTGYYLDPTSATSLRTVGDWRSDSTTWTGEYSGKIQYHSNNWYFQAADQFIWRNSSGSNVVYGDQAGNHWAVASSRSPIFYDNNDTGYYIDPNSTGAAALRMRGGALFGPNPTWGRYLYIGGNGDYDSAEAQIFTTNGNLHLEAKSGNSIYLASYRGSWFYANGWYDYNDSAYYVDPNSTSRMYQINFNNLYYAPDTSYGFIGTSIYVDTINSGYSTDQLEINYVRGTWAGISHDSLRAPIFYDYDDTGRYVNPNGDSHVNDFYSHGWFRNYGQQGLYNQDYGGHVYMRSSGIWVMTGNGGNFELQCRSNHESTLRGFLYGDTSGNFGLLDSGGSWRVRVDTGNVEHYGTTWTTTQYGYIWYDRNDSGYYVDPNSNSNMYKVTAYQGARYQTTDWADGFRNTPISSRTFHGDVSAGGPQGTWWFYDSMRHSNGSNYWGTQIAYGWEDNANEIWQRNISGNSFTGWVRYLNTNNYTGTLDGRYLRENVWINDKYFGTDGLIYCNQSRPYIMYDRNDTGYYVDPNSYSYVSSLRAGSYLASSGNIYTDSNYGYGHVGVYTSTRYQGVFAMGDSYKLPADGTTTGSLYGIAWSHPNAGGTAANLNTHGALILENGGFLAALSGSIRCRDDMRAPIFYDSNNTAYYVDPNATGTSINVAGTITAAGNVTAYSDIRVKRDVKPITNAIAKVKELNGVTFMRTDVEDARQTGVIAQDVLKVLPEAVRGSEKELYSVAYGNMVGLLVEAIKEQQSEIEELKSLVKQLLAN